MLTGIHVLVLGISRILSQGLPSVNTKPYNNIVNCYAYSTTHPIRYHPRGGNFNLLPSSSDTSIASYAQHFSRPHQNPPENNHHKMIQASLVLRITPRCRLSSNFTRKMHIHDELNKHANKYSQNRYVQGKLKTAIRRQMVMLGFEIRHIPIKSMQGWHVNAHQTPGYNLTLSTSEVRLRLRQTSEVISLTIDHPTVYLHPLQSLPKPPRQ